MSARSLLAILLIAGCSAGNAAPEVAVAVYAQAFNGYTRTRLPNGSFKPETFAFAEGSHSTSVADPSIDDLSFPKIIHILARPLKARGYVPSFDAKHTDEVIFVYWGRTVGSKDGQYSYGRDLYINTMNEWRGQIPPGVEKALEGTNGSINPYQLNSIWGTLRQVESAKMDEAQQLMDMSNQQIDRNDSSNADLLGYRDLLRRSWDIPWFGLAYDPVEELEADRYYVVLIALDYNTLARKKGGKLLWEAKVSIDVRGNPFDENLAAMMAAASRHFGENLQKLVHEDVPEGTVTVGTPVLVKDAPQK